MPTISSQQPANILTTRYFDFLNKESMVDCTLVADGYMMHAHKIVLAATSSYFEEIFAIIPDKHPAIVLSDVPHSYLSMMMEFIYCGKVDVENQDVHKFQKILKNLRIDSIKTDDTITSSFFDSNVVKIKEEKVDEVVEPSYDDEQIEDIDMDDDDENYLTEGDSRSGDGEYIPMRTATSQRMAKIRQNFVKTLSARPRPPGLMRMQSQGTSKPRTRIENVVKDDEAKAFMDLHPEICPFCKKKAKTLKHRNEHVKYCSENPDRVVSKCPYCDKSFCDPYYVRKHVKTIHSKVMGGMKFEKSYHL